MTSETKDFGKVLRDRIASDPKLAVGIIDEKDETIAKLRTENERLKGEIADRQKSFDLRWNSDMRAIALWRAEKPEERELIQPDHADLCVWLMAKLAAAEKRQQSLIDKLGEAELKRDEALGRVELALRLNAELLEIAHEISSALTKESKTHE